MKVISQDKTTEVDYQDSFFGIVIKPDPLYIGSHCGILYATAHKTFERKQLGYFADADEARIALIKIHSAAARRYPSIWVHKRY